MPAVRLGSRLSYVFLCAAPFVVAATTAVHALRTSPLHQLIGLVLFSAIALAVWWLAQPAFRNGTTEQRQLALGGALLAAPFALMGLLWVGLGTPWEATPADNQMRYLVLIAMGIANVSGFVMASAALGAAGQRTAATLVQATSLLAGPLFLVWATFLFGMCAANANEKTVVATFLALDRVSDVLLDIAELLTYFATVALAIALAGAQWLGRLCARVYVILGILAAAALVNRGLDYLSPAQLEAPWYTVPGFIVGIPAVPFIMPMLVGVVLLRRAGEQRR